MASEAPLDGASLALCAPAAEAAACLDGPSPELLGHTSPSILSPYAKRQRRPAGTPRSPVVVGFSSVEVLSHEPKLAADRVPSDSGPSIGLGRLAHVSIRRIDSFDTERLLERQGVRHVSGAERRERTPRRSDPTARVHARPASP